MGSHSCLPRPSVCGSLEPTALSMKLVLDVGSLVEKLSLHVFETLPYYLTPFVEPDRCFFSCASLFSRLPLTCSQDEETSPIIFCLLAVISLRISWAEIAQLQGQGKRAQYPHL